MTAALPILASSMGLFALIGALAAIFILQAERGALDALEADRERARGFWGNMNRMSKH